MNALSLPAFTLTELIDYAPYGLAYFEPIRTGEVITDFTLVRANDPARAWLSPGSKAEQWVSLTAGFPGAVATGLFAELVRVCRTATVGHFEQHDELRQRWASWSVRPLGTGLLVSLEDRTELRAARHAHHQLEARQQVLHTVFDTLGLGLMHCLPVRSRDGQVIDFEVIRTNPVADQCSDQPLVGKRISELYPHPTAGGLLGYLTAVLDSGIPYADEPLLTSGGSWTDLSAYREADGLLIVTQDSTAHRQAEQALAHQAATFSGVLSSMLHGLAVLKVIRDERGELADLRYEYISDQALADMGRSRSEVIGQSMVALNPGVRRSRYWLAYQHVLHSGTPERFEEHYNHDGLANYTYAEVARLDANRLVTTYQVINERKESQRRIRHQAELLQSILDASQDSILAVDARLDASGVLQDFVYVSMNSKGEAAIGRKLSDIQGKGMLDVFPAIRQTGLFAHYQQVWETGQPLQVEQHYAADGVEGWFLLSIVRRDTGLVITVTNTTPLQQARRQAEQQADLLRSVLDASPAIIVAFDPVVAPTGAVMDLQYVLQNQAHREDTGLSDEQVVGHTLLALFPSLQDSALLALYTQVAQTGNPYRGEYLFPNGNWYYVSAIKRGDGVVITATNIQAEKLAHQQMAHYQHQLEAANQALEQANGQLRQTNQNLQQLTYSASHDLQEPLRKIQTLSDLLATRYGADLPQPGQADLQRLQRSAAQMSVQIRDVLAYSQLMTAAEVFKTVSLPALIQQVAAGLAEPVARTGAVLSIGDLPQVVGGPDQLHQLFYNLLSNALTFTRPGVTPAVSVTAHDLGPQAIPPLLQGQPTTNWWEIRVADNGIGFDEKYLEQIFGLFQRLQSKSRYGGGSGMGLAICRRVVDNHGGYITARSQPGQGSTFLVYLPRV